MRFSAMFLADLGRNSVRSWGWLIFLMTAQPSGRQFRSDLSVEELLGHLPCFQVCSAQANFVISAFG